MLFSARRPQTQKIPEVPFETEEEEEESKQIQLKVATLPPYDGVIPLKETKFISYGTKMHGIRFIDSFSTNLESTS